jgi:hypothetical protein
MQANWIQVVGVKWAPYAKCNYCFSPQAICNKWLEDAHMQGGYQSIGGRVPCQFDRVLPQAVAALLAFKSAECRPWLEAQMQRARVVDGSFEVRQRQWLGQKMQIGQRNASRMCSLLYAWEEGLV